MLNNSEPGQFSLTGDVTFTSISKQLSHLLKVLNGSKHIMIDLSQVNSVDSSALALLIEWKKLARSNRIQLGLKNIPEQLLMLAELSGFDLNEHFSIHSD